MKTNGTNFGATIAAIIIAAVVRWFLEPLLNDGAPFSTFIIAVIFAAWFGGMRSALLATVLGFCVAYPLFIWPKNPVVDLTVPTISRFAMYFIICSSIATFGEAMRIAQRRLAESAKNTTTTLETMTQGFQRFNSQWQFEYVNAEAEKLTGRLRSDLLGKILWDEFPALLGTPVEDAFRRAAEQKVVAEFENYYEPWGRWFNLKVYPALDGGIAVFFQDITDQKCADSLQSEQRRILEMIATGVPMPQVLEALCRLIEEQEPGLICSILLADDSGKYTVRGIGPGLPESLIRSLEGIEMASPCTDACFKSLDSGDDALTMHLKSEMHVSGEWRELNLGHGLLACRSFPVLRSDGTVLASVAVFRREERDPRPSNRQLLGIVTHLAGIAIERSRTSQALADSEKHMRLLWEAAAVLLTTDEPDAMLSQLFAKIAPHLKLDAYFNFMVNEAKNGLRLASCCGISDETSRSIENLAFGQAICGKVALIREPIVATYIQQSDDPKTQLIRGLGIRTYACNPLMANGQLLGTLSFASRSRDQFAPDELDFLQTICQYVTSAYERLRLISQLQEADRRKDEFLATLAHELRNPLAPLRYGLQVMRLVGNMPEAVHEPQEIMERQLGQMVRLIDDLLDVSRISRGKIALRKERVELSQIILHAVETSRPLIEQGSHELIVDVAGSTPIYVDADETRLAQVFSNLLNNSAKYTNTGGRIIISATTEGSDAVISVEDNGVGIPAPMLGTIFEMFTQVDRSLEKSQGGLGIGLSLVKGLVEMHDGSVEARSDGLGSGSEFIVRVPLLISPTIGHGERSDFEFAQSADPRRILVVDDNVDAANSLSLMLKMMGHETRIAHNGLEALEVAAVYEPDLVMLDIGMPKMNGYEAARRIREEKWGTNISLIALTGWGQDDDRRKSYEAGFNLHMVKPIEPSSLEKLLLKLPTNTLAPVP